MEQFTLLILFAVFVLFVFIFLLFATANKNHKFIGMPEYDENNYNIPSSCSR
jgi:hypothetical protein